MFLHICLKASLLSVAEADPGLYPVIAYSEGDLEYFSFSIMSKHSAVYSSRTLT